MNHELEKVSLGNTYEGKNCVCEQGNPNPSFSFSSFLPDVLPIIINFSSIGAGVSFVWQVIISGLGLIRKGCKF